MKILVLLSRVPFPLDKGDKLRAFHQIKHLSQQHEIVLCCLNDSKLHKYAIAYLQPYCIDVTIIPLKKIPLFFSLVRGLFSANPLQIAYFYQQHAQKKIDRLIEKHLPKHIFCQLIRVTEYVKKYSIIPKTLDYMDAFSKGMERRTSNAPFYKKPFLRLEAKRLEQYEATIFKCFEHKTIISEQDKQYINHNQREEIMVIPNGVDTKYYHPIEKVKHYDLLFTGNMNYPPNIDGAVYLAKKILPIILKKYPSLKLCIAGVNPAFAVQSLRSKNIEVTGWVDDMRVVYAQSKIFVAPMQIGTGLQNKLLEAMAMKIPCITSSLANNAIGATEGKILIGRNPQDYANHIFTLLENETTYQQIAENAYQFVLSRFNWEATTRELIKVMKID